MPFQKPLGKLQTEMERLAHTMLGLAPGGKIVCTSVKARPFLKTVEIEGRYGNGSWLLVAGFYGPQHLYQVMLTFNAVAEPVLRPLTEAFLDRARFEDADLGQPVTDDAIRAASGLVAEDAHWS